ncbi:50S ribosomal protein L13 [Candidatus Gottesmanbacteria bacterium RBG_13_37_7]|uniref:Large ribosomal subunit protein uL13 n=1 Tax=Candidatus Gottesmanbacteria bacterium RBG_13_37_7 TaxID=1798369 RepID=A0A1F5YIU4_9BACT|nr:MAG: 50S ribosomal protein L13 [Candidatus Gottesmanbacteria bacterium RBG_13_37_7]
MEMTKSTKATDIQRKWHLIDVKGEILGRVASKIAQLLIGKSKPYYVGYLDCGDYVVVINASGIKVTGNKEKNKTYHRFSGYPGGLKKKTYREVKKENPTRILNEAISGMLPKNKLRASMLRRIYIYQNEEYPYKDKFNNK